MNLSDKEIARSAEWLRQAMLTICRPRGAVETMSPEIFKRYVENIIKSAIALGYELSQQNIISPSPGKTDTPKDQTSSTEGKS